MGQKTQIVGNTGKGVEREVHVHPFKTATGNHMGLVNLTHPFIETEPSTKFFTNPTNGIAMNQAVTFGGTRLNATVLHAGVDSGSAIAGTTDVATGAKTAALYVGKVFEIYNLQSDNISQKYLSEVGDKVIVETVQA